MNQATTTLTRTVYLEARERNPRRWSGETRNWSRVEVVTLNPERDAVAAALAAATSDKQCLAA